jgi:hypothetical protein
LRFRKDRRISDKNEVMIRISVTEAALEAIAKTLPEETVRQVDRRGGQCFIHLTDAIADGLGAMRGPGESYSDVILRLVGLETKSLP